MSYPWNRPKRWKPKPLDPQLYSAEQVAASKGELPDDHPAWRRIDTNAAGQPLNPHTAARWRTDAWASAEAISTALSDEGATDVS